MRYLSWPQPRRISCCLLYTSFGLSAVKNVGAKAVELIIQERAHKPYEDFFSFLRRVPADALNKRMVESMIKAGCFDSFHVKRSQLMAVFESTMDAMAHDRKRNLEGQVSLFEGLLGENVPSLVPCLLYTSRCV